MREDEGTDGSTAETDGATPGGLFLRWRLTSFVARTAVLADTRSTETVVPRSGLEKGYDDPYDTGKSQ